MPQLSGLCTVTDVYDQESEDVMNAISSTSSMNAYQYGIAGIQAAMARLNTSADGVARVADVASGNGSGGYQAAYQQFQTPFDPTSANADTSGVERQTSMNLVDQMVQSRVAVLDVHANVRSIDAARSVYEQILSIGDA